MSFWINCPKGFTHRARIQGIPCWAKIGGETPEIVGTNVVADWCILYVSPFLSWLCDWIGERFGMEPCGFRIELLEEIGDDE